MTVVFQIHRVITRKEEASPPLQHFPVVCATIISTTTVHWNNSCVDFLFKIFFFSFLSLCLCSSRCTRLPVRWERRSPNIRRPWHSVCTGVGTKCSWGSPHTWFCSGCVCLLALFSTAWWELCLTHIQNYICWPLRIFHAVFEQTILAGLYVKSVFAFYGITSSKIDQRESWILYC